MILYVLYTRFRIPLNLLSDIVIDINILQYACALLLLSEIPILINIKFGVTQGTASQNPDTFIDIHSFTIYLIYTFFKVQYADDIESILIYEDNVHVLLIHI